MVWRAAPSLRFNQWNMWLGIAGLLHQGAPRLATKWEMIPRHLGLLEAIAERRGRSAAAPRLPPPALGGRQGFHTAHSFVSCGGKGRVERHWPKSPRQRQIEGREKEWQREVKDKEKRVESPCVCLGVCAGGGLSHPGLPLSFPQRPRDISLFPVSRVRVCAEQLSPKANTFSYDTYFSVALAFA